MARIDALPSIDIIRGFKGVLDFYMWKGLPCVRAWPAWRPARQSNASRAAALLFGAVIQAFRLTHYTVTQQLEIEATGIPRTPRDIYLSGVYGNLHEASMSDFLTLLTQCRDFLSALQAILNALDSIDTDELVVNVDQSVLPPLAATTTNQATQITALQKIDDLQDALESKALDRLLVRGMDQVFSIRNVFARTIQPVISGAGGYVESAVVGASRFRVVTSIVASDITNPCTRIRLVNFHDGAVVHIDAETAAFPAGERFTWGGFTYQDVDDTIRAYFAGALAGDTCRLDVTGFTMTLET